MTLNEFKAWLEGFSASFDDAPNAEQWAVIQDKLARIQAPLTYAPEILPREQTTVPWGRWPYTVTSTNDAPERLFHHQV